MTTLTAQLPALQVVVPMLLAPMVTLLHGGRLAWAAATLTSGLCLAIAVEMTRSVLGGEALSYAMGGWAAPYGIALQVDALSALLLLVVTGASTVALVAARDSIPAQIGAAREPLYYAAWLLALAGLCGILVTDDAFNIFVFMEISSLATYVLIGGGPDRRALRAVYKYLIIGTVGATFYLIGVGLLYMMTGTLNLSDLGVRLAEVEDLKPVFVAAGFVSIGLALKAAVFPLHAWLPNAYTFAPHAASAFIAACSTKVAIYVLLRLDFFVFQAGLADHGAQFSLVLMPLAALGVLFGSVVAVFERNLKRLLAFSSIAQLGYILLGASLMSVAGLTASGLHLFNHALAKGACFLVVVCLGLRYSRMQLADLAGAGRAMPWTMSAFVVAGLSLIGVPGTAGFVSKWALIAAAMGEGALGVALVVLILFSSLLAVIYVWRVVECTFFGTPESGAASPREAPAWMLACVWIAALANVYFGFDAAVPAALAGDSAQALMRHLR